MVPLKQGTTLLTATSIRLDISLQRYVMMMITPNIYFAAISLFRSRLLSRATKIILYKTLIRPVVSYGAEA